MRKVFIRKSSLRAVMVHMAAFVLFFAVWGGASAQIDTTDTSDTITGANPAPSRESFVNQVFRTEVDSSFSTYRLAINAYPCSFVKFEYDEWVKYALREDVPIYVLNELAGKSFMDKAPSLWRPDSLFHAVCIDDEEADSVLDPDWFRPASLNTAALKPGRSNPAARKAWLRLPPEQRTVFYFSRPVFTADGEYAILDMDYHCDSRLCGMGSTCLFRRTVKGWRLAGRKLNWGSR
jgi:hypothetical protein